MYIGAHRYMQVTRIASLTSSVTVVDNVSAWGAGGQGLITDRVDQKMLKYTGFSWLI